MTTYAQLFVALLPAPLSGPWGQSFANAVGGFLDGVLSQAQDAVEAHTFTFCQDDALPLVGGNYNLPQLPAEANSAYRARLGGAWTAWSFAGTDVAILSQLGLLGFTASTIRTTLEWSPDAPPGAHPEAWARFWVILSPVPSWWRSDDAWNAIDTWDDGALWDDGGTWEEGGIWDDGGTWDSNVSPADVALVVRTVSKWQSARDTAWVLVPLGGSDFYSPVEPWDSGAWDDTATMFWPVP